MFAVAGPLLEDQGLMGYRTYVLPALMHSPARPFSFLSCPPPTDRAHDLLAPCPHAFPCPALFLFCCPPPTDRAHDPLAFCPQAWRAQDAMISRLHMHHTCHLTHLSLRGVCAPAERHRRDAAPLAAADADARGRRAGAEHELPGALVPWCRA